jgi:integrase/recombinase XerD
MEVLYSTGVRRMELANLKLTDLDYERGTAMVRQGKGRKDRMVPIGDRALAWVRKYVDEARGDFALAPDEGAVFLTLQGLKFDPDSLTSLMSDYIRASGVGKGGSCHLFRHTMATLMLENGADVRVIQEILGHANLETTQIYTRVSIRHLKDVHTLTHPARMSRLDGVARDDGMRPAESAPAAPVATPEDLLAALKREADEEA